MKKKAVVTGGAGFVGSHITRELLSRGWEVEVIDTFVLGRKEAYEHEGATYHEVDVRDSKKIANIIAGATAVFHMAALPSVQYSIEHPAETNTTNFGGTLAVLDAVRLAGGGARVVLMSSASCYGDQDTLPLVEGMEARPKSQYALDKYMSECLLRVWSDVYGIESVALRCFNIYGPGMRNKGAYASAIGTFLSQRKEGKPLTVVGDGTQTRDFVHVYDVIRANMLAAESPQVGHAEVINIGSGSEISVNEIARLVGGEKAYVAPRIEPLRSRADITRAKEMLGFEPIISFESGIGELKKLAGI